VLTANVSSSRLSPECAEDDEPTNSSMEDTLRSAIDGYLDSTRTDSYEAHAVEDIDEYEVSMGDSCPLCNRCNTVLIAKSIKISGMFFLHGYTPCCTLDDFSLIVHIALTLCALCVHNADCPLHLPGNSTT
jgi:hypothetical protein